MSKISAQAQVLLKATKALDKDVENLMLNYMKLRLEMQDALETYVDKIVVEES